MGKYIYQYLDNLYINLTNNCTNNCVFCVKHQGDYMAGNNLKLEKNPTGEEIIELLEREDLSKYPLVVFCGYGEPTMNLPALLKVAKYLRTRDVTVKLNTNGHGNKYNNRNIVEDLVGLIDIVSISLNEYNADFYDKINKSIYGKDAFNATVDFIKSCSGRFKKVVVSVVDIIDDEHIEKCKQMAKDFGVEFRLRKYTRY